MTNVYIIDFGLMLRSPADPMMPTCQSAEFLPWGSSLFENTPPAYSEPASDFLSMPRGNLIGNSNSINTQFGGQAIDANTSNQALGMRFGTYQHFDPQPMSANRKVVRPPSTAQTYYQMGPIQRPDHSVSEDSFSEQCSSSGVMSYSQMSTTNTSTPEKTLNELHYPSSSARLPPGSNAGVQGNNQAWVNIQNLYALQQRQHQQEYEPQSQNRFFERPGRMMLWAQPNNNDVDLFYQDRSERDSAALASFSENRDEPCTWAGELPSIKNYKYPVTFSCKSRIRKIGTLALTLQNFQTQVEVIPWVISDSNYAKVSQKLDPHKTVFVGALHGMIHAEGLAYIMSELFGPVVYADEFPPRDIGRWSPALDLCDEQSRLRLLRHDWQMLIRDDTTPKRPTCHWWSFPAQRKPSGSQCTACTKSRKHRTAVNIWFFCIADKIKLNRHVTHLRTSQPSKKHILWFASHNVSVQSGMTLQDVRFSPSTLLTFVISLPRREAIVRSGWTSTYFLVNYGPIAFQAILLSSDCFLMSRNCSDCIIFSFSLQWIEPMADAGVDQYTFHVESSPNVLTTCRKVKEAGMKVGVALKPKTDVMVVKDYIEHADLVLIMTVEPGFGGQKFMADMMPKVKWLRDNYPTIDIEVDGGVGLNTIDECAKAGANMIVSGTAVAKAPNPAAVISSLRNTVNQSLMSL
ncbi:unnamed protein product [Nesidiocoris tenuis]|uniref:ribulose-phosphate 3-epimerase n=1 Tax=Nesidiocoris tenuis TaxID=355587 RepID=A0A6H5HQD3_9HEMI|nr:unnamed protein product [Nesidiocoris tenuis]